MFSAAAADSNTSLDTNWELLTVAAGAAALPDDVAMRTDWIPAVVPGTVALTLQRAGRWSLDSPTPLHMDDHWYRCRFTATGAQWLRFEGLATCAEAWLNGQPILDSNSMFIAYRIPVTCSEHNELYLRFKALLPLLARPMKRARWRPTMIEPVGLRSVRTTLLGHMPGWCPAVHMIGPWRCITCVPRDTLQLLDVKLRAELHGEDRGLLRVSFRFDREVLTPPMLRCGHDGVLNDIQMHRVGDVWSAILNLDTVTPWWPHTHGIPTLYHVSVICDEQTIALGKVGFRRIEVDRGEQGDEFSLLVNGARVFCRGACWTSADIVGLQGDRHTYAPWLKQMQSANMNMVRLSGTTVYEANPFYELCDELGLMVWQDFMFANFDYPVNDTEFEQQVRLEVRQFLERTQCSPCITVLCGGSEVLQQAAMLGLPAASRNSVLFTEWLPELCRQWRDEVPYVENSPSGGSLPFLANTGVTHYYGVGAYQRPLDDARRAEVKFASECLAFANVPEARSLQALPVPAVHHPLWKQRVPRDLGASWDFEDTRDFYLSYLYRLDAALLRRTESERYLAMSRAVTADIMEQVLAEWRRSRSRTAGALVWTYQDLWLGAGWGVVDAAGEPKAAWYALRRAFRPVQLAMTDEGVNGLALHLCNETSQMVRGKLRLECRQGGRAIVEGEQLVELAPRSNSEIGSAQLLTHFFDVTYAYRFGPPAHDINVATLHDANTGDLLASASHFPRGIDTTPRPLGWAVTVERSQHEWYLLIETEQTAVFVHIDDEHFRAEENWFHLPAKVQHRVRLLPRQLAEDLLPQGEVKALNGTHPVAYRGTV